MSNKSEKIFITQPEQNKVALDFGGVVVYLDLTTVKMTNTQKDILQKILSKKPNLTVEEYTGDDYPASKILSHEEFNQIRSLKATLGTHETIAGFICNFSLKCVAV